MITVDEQYLQNVLANWSRKVAGYINDLGLSVEKTVERQSGLLARTLVNISPPADRTKTAKNIEGSLLSKFDALREAPLLWGDKFSKRSGRRLSKASSKFGSGSVTWYAWNDHALYGVSTEKRDLRDISATALIHLAHHMTPKGRFQVGRRGKQAVYISQKTLTSRKTLRVSIDILKKRIGRLKAGWLVAWRGLGSPGSQIPDWIARHEPGARGFLINSASIPGDPSVTIANFAKGVKELKKSGGFLLRRALEIRAKAMANDIKFAIKNPKKWKERQAAAGLEVGDFS